MNFGSEDFLMEEQWVICLFLKKFFGIKSFFEQKITLLIIALFSAKTW